LRTLAVKRPEAAPEFGRDGVVADSVKLRDLAPGPRFWGFARSRPSAFLTGFLIAGLCAVCVINQIDPMMNRWWNPVSIRVTGSLS
jgi:hypothetical protein